MFMVGINVNLKQLGTTQLCWMLKHYGLSPEAILGFKTNCVQGSMIAAGQVNDEFLTRMGYTVPVQRLGILSLLERIIEEDSNPEISQESYVGAYERSSSGM